MADGGGLPSLVLRLSLLLLLLGLASLQLQAWTARKAVEGNVPSQKMVKSARSVKHKNIVQGEAAGQGIPDRVQCEDFPTKKNDSMETNKQKMLRHRPCLFSEKETVSFVTLFVLLEAEPIKTKKTTSIQKIETKNLHAVLRAFLESIQDFKVEGAANILFSRSLFIFKSAGVQLQLVVGKYHDENGTLEFEVSMPDTTRVTVITNQSKLKGELPQNVDWRPTTRQYNRRNLMIRRLESYITFLEGAMNKRKNRSEKPSTHVIFSDFDMIVVDDLGCLFRDYPFFDVALTYRNNRKQPINSGVIMVRGTLESLSRAKSLLKEAVKVYRVKFRHAFGILGDQLAFAEVVNATLQARKSEGVPFEALVKATRILFLPCAIYNWTPSEGAGQFHGMPIEVKILHFKGSRKRLMIHAWSLYKQQGVKDFSNMKCLLLKSGRSKYDY